MFPPKTHDKVKMFRTKSQGRKPRQPIEGLFCTYSHRICMQNRLEGYEFCLKHILEDKNSPFKQCSYNSAKSGKKCTNAAPKSDRKEGYCLEHSRRAMMMRQRASRKKRPKETPELLLEDLDHYSGYGKRGEKLPNSDQVQTKKSHISLASKVLEYTSSSDSDAETPVVDQAWRGDGDSDAESVDSEQEDLLKHAGVHTAEEVALIMRDKLIRLQSLYIDQFKRLQHVMREKRRKFLHTHRLEKDAQGSIGQYMFDTDQQENYKKLTAMKRYHKRYGKEALLHRQSKQRRIAVSEGVNYRPPSYPKCIFTDLQGKCPSRALPLSKYCLDHILQDSHQVLFRGCSFADGSCGRPVASTDETPFCSFHSPLTDFEPRLSLKRDSTPEPLLDEGPSITKAASSLTETLSQSDSKMTTDQEEDELDPNSEAALMKKGRLLFQHLQNIDAKLKAQKHLLPMQRPSSLSKRMSVPVQTLKKPESASTTTTTSAIPSHLQTKTVSPTETGVKGQGLSQTIAAPVPVTSSDLLVTLTSTAVNTATTSPVVSKLGENKTSTTVSSVPMATSSAVSNSLQQQPLTATSNFSSTTVTSNKKEIAMETEGGGGSENMEVDEQNSDQSTERNELHQ